MIRTPLPALALALAALAAPASACMEGTKCISVPKRDYKAPYAVGDTLPRGQYNVLLNSTYHGLPGSDGSFYYFQVDRHVLKVDPQTMEVLGDVTSKARRLPRR